jgi:hypothetical protein
MVMEKSDAKRRNCDATWWRYRMASLNFFFDDVDALFKRGCKRMPARHKMDTRKSTSALVQNACRIYVKEPGIAVSVPA